MLGYLERSMSRLVSLNDHITSGDMEEMDPFLAHLRSVLPRGNWEVFNK